LNDGRYPFTPDFFKGFFGRRFNFLQNGGHMNAGWRNAAMHVRQGVHHMHQQHLSRKGKSTSALSTVYLQPGAEHPVFMASNHRE
jgi:hypothetical protein